MPSEETKDYIRSGHESTDKFDKDSIRTITLDDGKGIKALVGCPRGNYDSKKCQFGTQFLSFIFSKDKGWTMDDAEAWFARSKK